MYSRALKFLKDFYGRNLFERLIVYAFLSHLMTTIAFELVFGQWGFVQSQNQQWIFYGLLALDYIVSYRKIINIRVTVNPMSLFAFVFFIMVAQGLFVGIMSHNRPFVILNDTIPLLMIGLNILRMQSGYEYQEPDFRRLLTTCTILAAGTCFAGLLAQTIGKPSAPSLGVGSIYLPLLLAGLFLLRPFPRWTAIAAAIMIALVLPDMNRTTMAFCATAIAGYAGYRFLKNPVYGLAILLAAVMACSALWAFLPQDSKTYGRITGLTHIDLSERTGSIGERQAEWDAIQAKLDRKGETYQWLGLGFGGVYEVARTHQYLTNYGHAHYSWAWFNLRFGKIGYLYLALLVGALIYNGLRGLQRKDENGLFLCLLCLLGLIYCVTYINSIFLLSGIHFFYSRTKQANNDT